MSSEYFEHSEYDFEWMELDGVLGLGDCPFDFITVPDDILFWRVVVYSRVDEATQTYAETLYQPAEYKLTYELDHVNISLIIKDSNGINHTLMTMKEWDGWEEFENIKAKIDSIDWSEVHY